MNLKTLALSAPAVRRTLDVLHDVKAQLAHETALPLDVIRSLASVEDDEEWRAVVAVVVAHGGRLALLVEPDEHAGIAEHVA